jgi:glycosyltransferase involved in cell wall biosynthesis
MAPMALGMKEGACRGLVSVITPTYNRAWSLRKSVGSVFAQDYRPIECIVVDDGSTDETPTVMEELMTAAPEGIELRYFRKPNGGANSARNRGLTESRGEFICFLDSDDALLPESVNVRADILLADPSVDFCYGLCSVQDESGKELRKMNRPWPGPGEARIAAYLFATISPLIRRSVCAKAGLWREDDTHSQEYEYFSRVKFFSRSAVFIDRTLSVYLRHGKGNIFDMKDHAFCLAIFRVLLAVKSLVLYSPYDGKGERQCLAREFVDVAKHLRRLGDPACACDALLNSMVMRFRVKTLLRYVFYAMQRLSRSLFRACRPERQ